MLQPAPTTKIDEKIARAVLAEKGSETVGKPDYIALEFANTSYRMHLKPTAPIAAAVGERILGTIGADARRIDLVGTGGRYVEPVWGPPRRVQGRVVAITPEAVVVHAGMPIHCRPTERDQKPGDFAEGQLVSFDVLPGATFTPA